MLAQTNSTSAEGPVVEIMPSVLAKLQIYVEECPGEVSGFGLMHVVDGSLVIDDVFIAGQRCSATSTEIGEEDLAEFLDELLARGADPGQLHLYWHSHADMQVFWSSTDIHTMETAFPHAAWVLGLVMNRRGEMMTCLQIYQPLRVRLYDLPMRLQRHNLDLRAQIREEIRRKVRQDNRSVPVGQTFGHWGHGVPAARFQPRGEQGFTEHATPLAWSGDAADN